MLDQSGDGSISAEELKSILEAAVSDGREFTIEEVQQMITSVEGDGGDGQI